MISYLDPPYAENLESLQKQAAHLVPSNVVLAEPPGFAGHEQIWFDPLMNNEAKSLVQILKSVDCKVVVEIGLRAAGSHAIMKMISPLVISIDFDLPAILTSGLMYEKLGQSEGSVFIYGDSRKQSTVDKLAEVLGGKQIDVLLIDSDHRYEFVKSDYENYQRFVRPGGIIIVHDYSQEETRRAVQEIIGDRELNVVKENAWFAYFRQTGTQPTSNPPETVTSFASDESIGIPMWVRYDPFYLYMACLCVKSMRSNNINYPIYFMVDETLFDHPYWRYIDNLNIRKVKIQHGIRQWAWELLFDLYGNLQTLITADTDQYFHNCPIDFSKLVNPEYHLQLFYNDMWQHMTAYDHFQTRLSQFYGSVDDLGCLYEEDGFGHYDHFLEFLKQRRWIWGNFCILDRSIIQTKFWKVVRRMGYIYPDDEMAMLMGMYLDPKVKYRWLNESIIQKQVSLREVVQNPDASFLAHFCGPDLKKESLVAMQELWNRSFPPLDPPLERRNA